MAKKRKISFNFLLFKQGDLELEVLAPLQTLLEYTAEKTNVEIKQNLSSDKFAFLAQHDIFRNPDGTLLITMLFKNARHSYRAPLLDKNTVQARENPKTMDEGEQNKTHLLIKVKDGNALMFVETGPGLLTCNNIVDYLNKLLQDYNSQDIEEDQRIQGKLTSEMMPRDDFDEVLHNMSRVVCAEIFVDKRILGSEMLDYTEPSEEMKSEVVLTLKANKKRNILAEVYRLVDKWNGAHPDVKRIRVRGKMDNGQESIIDTDFIVKKEYIEAVQNVETGEYDSVIMFEQLKSLSREY